MAKTIRSSGTKELLDEVKGIQSAISSVGDAFRSLKDSEVEFRTKGADKVVKDAKSVTEAIDEVKSASEAAQKAGVSDDLLGALGNTKAVQNRIQHLKDEMEGFWRAVTNEDGNWNGEILKESEMERMLAYLKELQKYASMGATKISKRYIEMANNAKNLAPSGMFPNGVKAYYDSSSKGEAEYQYNKYINQAKTEFNRTAREQEKNAMEGLASVLQQLRQGYEDLNSVADTAADSTRESGMAAEEASSQFMALSDAYRQLTEIEGQIRKFKKSVTGLENEGVSNPDITFDGEELNEKDYVEELNKISQIIEEINQAKKQLGSMAIDPNANQAVKRQNTSTSDLDDLLSRLQERKRVVEEYLQSDAFLENRIQKAQDDLRSRITSNADFEEYGDTSWIDKYVEDLRDGMRDGTKTIDDIYTNFIEALRANKERIIQEREFEAQGERDAQAFDDFLKTKAFGDIDTYEEYFAKYQDVYTQIKEHKTKLVDEIIRVGAEIDEALKQSGEMGTGGGSSEPERLIEYLETLEELKVRASRLESQGPITDEDVHSRLWLGMESGWDLDIEGYEDDLSKLEQYLQKLIELRDKALSEARYSQETYLDYGNQSDFNEMNDYLGKYNEYVAGITYLQDKIASVKQDKINEMMSFESTGEWDAENIQFVIEAIKLLAQEMQNLVKVFGEVDQATGASAFTKMSDNIQQMAQAMGTVDEEAGVTTLLSQLKELSGAITTAFDASNIEQFREALMGVGEALQNIQNSIGVIGGGNSKASQADGLSIRDRLRNIQARAGGQELTMNIIEGASDAEKKEGKMWKDERARYMKVYDRIIENMRKQGAAHPEDTIFSELMAVPEIYGEFSYSGANMNDLFSRAKIGAIESDEKAVERLQMLIGYLKQAFEHYQEYEDKWKMIQAIPDEAKKLEELASFTYKQEPIEKGSFWDLTRSSLKTVSADPTRMRKKTKAVYNDAETNKKSLQDVVMEALGLKNDTENSQLADYQQRLDEMMGKIQEFNTVLSKGFGIQEKDGGITSFLSELVAKMEEVAKAAQSMAESVQQAFDLMSGKQSQGATATDVTKLPDAVQQNINSKEYTAKVIMDPASKVSDDIRAEIQTGEPYKVVVEVDKGKIASDIHDAVGSQPVASGTKIDVAKSIEESISSVDTKGLGKALSDEFDINSHNSKLRGQVQSMVQEITQLLGQAFNGETFDMSGIKDRYTELVEDLTGLLGRSATSSYKNDYLQDLQLFYYEFKDTKFKATDQMISQMGNLWQDDIKHSRRVSTTEGYDLSKDFSEIYDIPLYKNLLDNFAEMNGYNLNAVGDQLMAMVKLIEHAKMMLTTDDIAFINDDELRGNVDAAEQSVNSMVENIKAKMKEAFASVSQDAGTANQTLADTMEQTGKSGAAATAGIKGEGDAAADAIKKKEELAKVNAKLADTMEQTGKSGATAAEGIKAEADATEEAERKQSPDKKNSDDYEEDKSDRWARTKYLLTPEGEAVSKVETSREKRDNKYITTSYRSSQERDEEGNLTGEWGLDSIEVVNDYEKAEAAKQRAIEKTNKFIIEQSSTLERLKERYIENAQVTINSKDLDELTALKKQIDDALAKLNADNFTDTNSTQIKQWIKDYQQKAQLAIARQQVSQDLAAYGPETTKRRQETRLNDLLRSMRMSDVDTTDLERRLGTLISNFKTSPDMSKEHFIDVRNQYGTLKSEFEDVDKQFRFNQGNIDKASAALEKYEKAVDNVAKAYTALNFADDKSDPVLVQNLDDAIKKADEAKAKLDELRRFVFDFKNVRLTTQEFKDDMLGRENAARAIQNDPTQSIYYRSAVGKADRENLAALNKQLAEYEKAVQGVVDAQIALDFSGKNTNTSGLVRRLEEAKQKAEEARTALDTLEHSFTSGFLSGRSTEERTDYMNRVNEARRQEADPTQSARYQAVADSDAFSKYLDDIQKAIHARDEFNKMTAQNVNGTYKGTTADVEELNARLEETKLKAIEALNAIMEMKNEGKVSFNHDQLASLQELERSVMLGSDKTRDLVDNAVVDRDVKIIDEAVASINRYYETAQKVEELHRKMAAGENVGKQYLNLVEQMNKAKKAADDAAKTLFGFYREGKYDPYLNNGETSGLDPDGLYWQTISRRSRAENFRRSALHENADYGFETAEKGYKTLTGLAEEYVRIQEKIRQEIALTFNEQSWLNKIGQYYRDAAEGAGVFEDAIRRASEEERPAVRESQNAYREALEEAQNNIYTQQYADVGDTLFKMGEKRLTDDGQQRLTELKAKYDELYDSIVNVSKASDEQKRIAREALDTLMKETNEFSGQVKDFTPANERDVAVVNRQMTDWATKNSSAYDFIPRIEELQSKLDGISVTGLEKVRAAFEDIKREAVEAGQVGLSFGDQLKKTFGGLARYLMTYASFYRVIGTFRQAVGVVKELDTALTEMRKVSDESIATLKNYQLETFDMADKVGTTAKQIQDSTADWMRLGESLEEARKSASYSTMLLNVSEFQDINAATESLTAMSQAYKELDKLDIIDKLNNIGNNFSISTSDLAKSLQKSAGTLKVTGDTLDEAIALTVAGNQTLQNPDIVGQSLKTISLRLSGTSVEDMQEAGEEIDGLISTTSKLRKKILDVTKVASNNYQGFDIVNDDGTYKTTYERLLGIAEIFKEIGEEDKKLGTNRQSFLLETLAGKTRAAAASSILEHPEILKEVWEQSQQSAGSAQEELDKYLDSIDGKLAKLKNRLQELAFNVVDSEGLKAVLDIVNSLISGVNELTKTFGGLNVVIGAAAGILMQKTGAGLLRYDKVKESWGAGGLGSLLTGSLGKKPRVKISDTVATVFSGLDLKEKFVDQIGDIGVLMDDIGETSFNNWVNSMDATRLSTISAGQALQEYKKYIGDAGGVMRSVTNIGVGLASTIANIGISMLATAAVSGFLQLMYSIIKADEIAIEKGKEATKAIEDRVKAYDELNSTLKETAKGIDDTTEEKTIEQSFETIAERYAKLRSGVNGITNENISLTNEEYQEYLDLCNQLAEQFPTLQSGWDNQGNSILTLSTNATEAEQSLMRMYEAAKLAAHVEIADDIQAAYAGKAAEIKTYEQQNKQLEEDIAQLNQQRELIEENGFGIVRNENGVAIESYTPERYDRMKEILTNKGYELIDDEFNQGNLGNAYQFQLNKAIDDETWEEIQKLYDSSGVNGLSMAEIQAGILKAEEKQHANELYIKDQRTAIAGIVGNYLNTSDVFSGLTTEMQNGIMGSLTQVDYSAIATEYDGNIVPYIYDKIIGPLSNIDEEASNKISEVLTTDATKGSIEDYQQRVRDVFTDVFGEDNSEYFMDLFGLSGQIEDATKKRRELLTRMTQDGVLDQDTATAIFNMSWGEIEKAYQLTSQKHYRNMEQLQKDMEKPLEIEPTDTLSNVFADESYKENAEKYEKNLTSLTGALTTLRSEGTLTAEAMRDLQEEFPDMTDFTIEGISNKAAEELKKWVAELRSGYDDLNEEGKQQIDTYTENLMRSYGDLDIDRSEALKEVRDQIVTGKTKADREEQIAQYDQLISDLEQKYGKNINWQLVWELALEDKLSADADQVYAEYDNKVISWDLQLRIDEIQKDIDSITSQRDLNSARQSLNEAMGIAMTEADYATDNELSERLIADYEEQKQIAIDKINSQYKNEGGEINIPPELQDQVAKQIQLEEDKYDKLILDERTKQIENNNAQRNIPLTHLENQGELLGISRQASKDAISRAENQGREVTEAMYRAAIEEEKNNQKNLEAQRRILYAEQNRLVKQYTDDEGILHQDALEQNQNWIDNQTAIADNKKAWDESADAVKNYGDAIENIPLTHLETSANAINRNLELAQREIDNPREYAGSDDYLRAIEKNAEKEFNIRAQIAEKMTDSRSQLETNDPGYQTWLSELNELEDQLYDTTTAQNEFVKSLAQLPMDNITREIEKYKNELATLQAEQEYRQTAGQYLTAGDYDANIELDKQMAIRSAGLGVLYSALSSGARALGDDKFADEMLAQSQQSRQDQLSFLGDIFNQRKARKELPIAEATRELEAAKLEATGLQEALDEATRSGRDLTEADYQGLKDNALEQIGYLETIRDENQKWADEYKTSSPADSATYAAAAVEAQSSIASLKQQQYEWNEAIKQMPITELVQGVGGYNDLQRDAAEIENNISTADAKRVKVTERLYNNLIKNGDKQIDNLKKQRREWENLQRGVDYGSSTWRDYQNEIDSIDDSITSMKNNQLGWLDTIQSLVATNAATLSSTLSTAFQEINSETGLTIDTMNELERQLGDLSGRDVSNIFYRSADGMKMNAGAAEALVDAEYELQTNNLYNAIAEQKSIIDELGGSEDASARASVSAAEQRIAAYNRELAMLQAQYDAQKDLFSARAAWETAQQTANAGADYEQIQGYLKTQKENYEKGLTGTDEFRAYTAYFDQWGIDTVDAWKRNKDKVERYMTEDVSGLRNFMNDLVSQGLATVDEDGMFELNLGDQEAGAMQMGMSKEWFNDMLSRSEDYGFINDWVDSELDGMLQIENKTQELIDQTLKLNKARRDGASQDVLDNQQAYIDEVQSEITNLKTATDVVREKEGKVSATQLQNAVSDINELQKLITPESSEQDIETIHNAIQSYADANHILLTPEFEVDEVAMEKTFPEWNVKVKPDWDALNEEIYGKPKSPDELGVDTPVGTQNAMELQTDETMLSAVDKVKTGWDENNEALQGYLTTLGNYSVEDLKAITLSDNKYNVEGNLVAAEDALQGIANMFGLNQEEASKLLTILEKIGAFNGGKQFEIPQTVSDIINTVATTAPRIAQTVSTQLKGTQIGDVVQETKTRFQGALQEFVQNAKEAERQQNIEEEAQPVVNSLTDTKTTISDVGTNIVNAITNLPGEIAQALSGEETEAPGVVEVQSTPSGAPAPTNPDLRGALSGQTSPGIGGVDVTQLSETQHPFVQPVTLVPQTEELEQEKTEIESTPVVQNVELQTSGATNTPQGTTITNTVTADTSSAEASMNRLAHMEGMSSQIDITARDNTSEGLAEANASVEQGIHDKTVNLNATDNITPTATNAKNSIDSIQGKNVALNLWIQGLDQIKNAKKEIQEMKDKRITVTTVNKRVAEAIGTATVAHASGTVYGKWETYRHSIGAYANGTMEDWELKADESALVNEFAPNHPESIVRDGKWMVIPGGPHVEQLKKGDIIFNAQQTDDLIRTGRTAHAGKLALSTGTAFNMMNAHVTTGGNRGSLTGNTTNTHQASALGTAVNNATNAVNNAAKTTEKNTAQQKKTSNALTKFQKGLANLKDWIEVRLNYRDYQIDLSQARSENATTYQKKNDTKDKNKLNALSAAQSWNRTKLKELEKAEGEYDKQIKKVRDLAVSSGLLKKGRADELLKKALTGSVGKKLSYDIEQMKGLIDSNGKAVTSKMTTKKQKSNSKSSNDSDNYTSKELAYVEALEEWINKMREATKAVEEAKQKIKEFAQMRLDNITEQADALVGYAESLQGISDSYINLATIRGKNAVNDKVFKREYDSQMEQQNFITGYLRGEYKAYQKELNNAARDFGVNSNQYHAALTKFNEIQSAIYDSEEKYYELRKEKAELEFTAISQVVDRIKSVSQLITGRSNLMSKTDNENVRGGSTNPQTFIDFNARQIQLNNGLAEQWKKQWDEAVEYMGTTQLTNENAKEYQEYYNKAIEAETEILGILENQEELKKNIRDLRWQGFEKLQENIQNAISDYDHLRDLMRESQNFDWEFGIEMQPEGYANISLIANSMERAKQQIKDYRRALELLNEDYKNGNITQTEFNEKSREYVEIIQSSAKAVAGYEDELVNMYQKQIQAENDLLQKNVQARKNALTAKKQYYDWDRQISQKNKDIASIQAQINSLQGVSNQAGVAQLAKLQAQLKEAQDDMADTMYQHEVDVRQTGYDKVAEDANKVLDDTLKKIDANQDARNEIIRYELELLNGHEQEAKDAIDKLMTSTGTWLSEYSQNRLDTSSAIIEKSLDKEWGKNVSTELNTLNTSKIPTLTTSVTNIEKAITNDLANLKGVQTQLQSIKDALKDSENIKTNEQEEAVKKLDEKEGSTGFAKNEIATPTDNGSKAAEQVEKTPGLDTKAQMELAERLRLEEEKARAAAAKAQAEAERAAQLARDKKYSQDQVMDNYNKLQTAFSKVQDIKVYLEQLEAKGASKDKINSAKKQYDTAYKQYQDWYHKVEYDNKNHKKQFGSDAVTTAQMNAVANSKTDPIKNAIMSGTKRKSKTLTTAEKKSHHALWEYIAKNYGYNSTNAIYKQLASYLGVKMSATPTSAQKDKLLKALKAAGYRKGTSNADDELNWLHDSEVIIRKSDGAILQPFNAGDMVFTSKQSENLWKMSQIPLDTIKDMVANPDMSKFIQPGITDRVGRVENNNQQIHIDSLIRIDGNADQQTVADIQQIANALINSRDFKKNLGNYVTKEMTREARKSGYHGK